MLSIAGFAFNSVAPAPIGRPHICLISARRSSIQANTARYVSVSMDRRTRDGVNSTLAENRTETYPVEQHVVRREAHRHSISSREE